MSGSSPTNDSGFKGAGSAAVKAAVATLRQLGLRLITNRDYSEYQVRFADDKNPEHGYFTNDLHDAVETGQAMHRERQQHKLTSGVVEIYQPLANRPDLIATATTTPPRSPLSGGAMELINVGAFGQPAFKAWVHVKDRIVLPYRP